MNNRDDKRQKEGAGSFIKERVESYEGIREIKAKKGMGAFGRTIVAIAVLGAVAIGVMAAWHFWITPKPAPTPVDITIVKEELSTIQDVATAKYTYTDVQSFSNSRQFPWGTNIPLTTKSFRIMYDGEIKAFFDMEKSDVRIDDSAVEIVLPQIQISHSLNNEVKEEHNNVFNPINIKDQQELVAGLKVIMENRAIELGIMDEARNKMEESITALLTPLLNEGQVLDIHQSEAAKKADAELVKETGAKATKAKENLKAIKQ